MHRSAELARGGARRRPAPVVSSGRAAALLLTLAALPVPALAQVGHSPGRSPYRDIRKGHMVTPIFGQFGGSGGRFEIGPHDGQTYGLRYDVRTGSAVQVGLGVAHASLTRLVVDPFVELANRTSGPVDQSVTFAEINVQLNLTGGKSWHRLAPFVSAGAGLTFPVSTPQDTSRFNFGKKFYLAPSTGVRVFVTDRVSLRGEARAVFWKLKYPTTFQDEPALEPGTPDHSNAVITDGRVTEWSTSSWLLVGVGIGFSP
ncbi:MAG TPA: hypothetical protein VHR43_13730 [Gemmatimonadales bacterium]|nr:hypothetical protein [Gemmatimonadales bacterium]